MTRLDYADFLPLFPLETEAAIRDRLNGWANEGLALDDPRIVDTREGSFFQIMTEGQVRISAQLHDRLSEAVAMSNPLIAGGYYLDLIAASRGLPRLPATPAVGVVTFTGTAGTQIPGGTPVSAPAPVIGDPAISFQTDAAVQIPALGTTVDATVTAQESGAAGNVAAGAITELDTPLAGVTVTNALPMAGGTDLESDDSLATRIISSYQNVGGSNRETIRGWALAYPGIGRASVRPNFYGPGTTLIIVAAADGSPVPAATVAGFQSEVDPANLTTTLTNPVTLPAGTLTVGSTLGSRAASVAAPEYLNVNGQIVTYTGSTPTTFTGVSGGTGAVPAGSSVTQTGSGGGLAPVGMYAKVETSALLPVTVVAYVHLDTGYGVSTTGLTDVYSFVHEALATYIDGISSGEEIILSQVLARIAESQGVLDVQYPTLLINGTNANLLVDDDPPQQAYLSSLTLNTY